MLSSNFYAACAMKLLSIVMGATAYGLGVHSYDETNLQEEYFLRSVQAYLILSAIYFSVILLSEKIAYLEINKAIDIVFHISGAIILLIVSGLLIYFAVDNERRYCDILHIEYPELFCQFYREKIAAGVITIMNGTVYALVAALIFLTHRKKTAEPNIYNYKKSFQEAKPRSFYFGTG